LQPIAVRPKPSGGYLIVAGERRWRASRMAGLTEVPVIVKDVTDEQAMELALVENLQREDLDPVEEAAGIRELMTRCDLTQEQAARKLGKSRSALANSLRLLSLPEIVLELLKSGFITIGHAKVVLGLPTPELQEEAAQMIADNQLNVRQAEALCKKLAKPAKEPVAAPLPSALPVEVEESLKQALGSEVRVAYHDGKGKLTVHFYSDDQLKAFANLLGQYSVE
jgi:ParB family chromosome partitioning protein